MRTLALAALLLAAPAVALPDGEGVVKDEKLNFTISLPPDSIDWKIVELSDALKKSGHAVYFRTEFADTDPLATCDVHLVITPMAKSHVRAPLEKIAKQWAPAYEDHLSNPRERKETTGKFGEVDYFMVDVQGDYLAGIHRRTWLIAKNGKFIYLIYIDRNYQAVKDDVLEDEVKQILGSFKFLRIEKVEKHKQGKAGAPEAGGPDGGKSKTKKIDPELLKKETFKEPFWRFECVKPQGTLNKKLTDDDKKRDTKYFFAADKDGSRLWLKIYAQTDKAKKYTLEALMEQRLKWWDLEVKVKKEPKIDKKYKIPLGKKVIRMDLVGRKNTTRKRIYIFAECKNDRQYILEVYFSGTHGAKLWKKAIDQFLKGFKPIKK